MTPCDRGCPEEPTSVGAASAAFVARAGGALASTEGGTGTSSVLTAGGALGLTAGAAAAAASSAMRALTVQLFKKMSVGECVSQAGQIQV